MTSDVVADSALRGDDVPAGACDCHVHVFGSPVAFPFSASRAYTPPEASVTQLCALHDALGLGRCVVVQASPYDADNRCLVSALGALGARARGVAVVAPDVGEHELERLHADGVRGARLNLSRVGPGEGDAAVRAVKALDAVVSDYKWHIQLYCDLTTAAYTSRVFSKLPIKAQLVFDHFAGASAETDPNGDAWRSVLDLLSDHRGYVKISATYRRFPGAESNSVVDELARSLLAANPDRVVWGSDWPHTAAGPKEPGRIDAVVPFQRIDDHQALHRARAWCATDEVTQAVFVDNPARLYDFDADRPV